MKAGREHRVPLSPRAVAILRKLENTRWQKLEQLIEKAISPIQAPYLLRIGRRVPSVNNGFTFQWSTRACFRFLSSRFGACPHLLDTIEEQIAAMFLIEWHRIVVA
jgi:integrase